jgi:hypothetical protein
MPLRGMAQCPHCQKSRWAIVAGRNVCAECGRPYEPPSARAPINAVRQLNEAQAESPPAHESGSDLERPETTAVSTNARADGRRRLLVIGSSAISIVLLFVVATLAFH